MRPVLLILVLFAVAESGKLKSEFLNSENENISPQERFIESRHLPRGLITNIVNAAANIAGKIKEKFGQTQELAREFGTSLGTIKDKFLNINSDLQNAIQDELEKTTDNDSENPQSRLILGPVQVELDVDLDLGPVEDYIKNKPGLREIAEDIGEQVADINQQVKETVAETAFNIIFTVARIQDQVDETVESIQEQVDNTVDSVQDNLENIAETITDTVDKVKSDEHVQYALGNAFENIKLNVKHVKKAVESAIIPKASHRPIIVS